MLSWVPNNRSQKTEKSRGTEKLCHTDTQTANNLYKPTTYTWGGGELGMRVTG